MIKIEELKKQDWDNFYNLFESSIKVDFETVSGEGRAFFINSVFSKEQFERQINAGKKGVFLAKDNQEIIGYLVFSFISGGINFLNWVMVKKEYRNKGIGRQLINI